MDISYIPPSLLRNLLVLLTDSSVLYQWLFEKANAAGISVCYLHRHNVYIKHIYIHIYMCILIYIYIFILIN
jgi:hypothetical protein